MVYEILGWKHYRLNGSGYARQESENTSDTRLQMENTGFNVV
jgi:hypothetical protein